MYERFKGLLFRLEPERAHDLTLHALEFASRHPGVLRLLDLAYRFKDARLSREVFGLTFPNPIGLAAGFDKNARALPALAALGFGFLEVGSVTAVPQPGNPKPRMFRLPEDEAILNRMGFNNEGAERVAERLERLAARGERPNIPIGVNLGKSRAVPLEHAAADYLRALERLWEQGDYFVVNVSSPNTPGLRDLQDAEPLERLLGALQGFAARQAKAKPLLLKVSPDLGPGQLGSVVAVALRQGFAGFVAVNTTLARSGLQRDPLEAGGLSGRPLGARALELLKQLVASQPLPVVAVGGILSAEDALERLAAGAALVQLYSGLVYRGPGLVQKTKRLLAERADHP